MSAMLLFLLLSCLLADHLTVAWLSSTTTTSTTMAPSTTSSTPFLPGTVRPTLRMDVEVPTASVTTTIPVRLPSILSKRWNQRPSSRRTQLSQPPTHQHHPSSREMRPSPAPINVQLDTTSLPWVASSGDNKDKFVYLSHWQWQMRYFQDHLTNLRVVTAITNFTNNNNDEGDGLLTRVSLDGKDRIHTVSLQSDEYRDIRMTYLHCDDGATQIFRCACYPRRSSSSSSSSSNGGGSERDALPVLGIGLMHFAGGRRNVAIMDYQPIGKSSSSSSNNEEELHSGPTFRPVDATYQAQLDVIRQQHDDFQQDMSDRHFDANGKQMYWSEKPLIAKWGVNVDAKESLQNDATWQQLETAHQRVVAAHVRTTQQLVGAAKTPQDRKDAIQSQLDDDQDLLRLHSDYDTFLSAREPAGHLLTKAFGPDVAKRMVRQVLFPLSRDD